MMAQLASSLTFGPFISDAQERINPDKLRGERAARLQAAMRSSGIPSLLLTGAANCRYAVGLRGAEFTPQLWYVLFFAESPPVVFGHAGYPQRMADEAPWIEEVRLARSWLSGCCGAEAAKEEAGLFAGEILAELQSRRLDKEPLGVIGVDETAVRALSAHLNVRSGWPVMLEAAACKTEEEIKCMKMSVNVAEAAWHPFMKGLREGLDERSLTRQAEDRQYALGAEDAMVGVRSGPLTFERGMRETGRIIRPGELLYGQLCGTSFMGYRSCLYRTFVVGRDPTPEEAGLYQHLVERLDAVIEGIRPGGSTAEAAQHFPPASKWGYEDEAEVLTIEIGHGTGIHQYEMPIINRQWSIRHPQEFKPGMVIAVEGREGSHEVGGVRLERMVLVTQTGAEILDRFPADKIVSIPFI